VSIRLEIVGMFGDGAKSGRERTTSQFFDVIISDLPSE